ncbi:MAG: hypothetical protein LBE80_07390 [Deltaproteobacteria bacterium]|nr:hypothetical protein [Deltaproteobacteria bacterium]
MPFILSDWPEARYKPSSAQGDYGASLLYQYPSPSFNSFKAINLDTGAIYGGALSALGLSAELLAQGRLLLMAAPTHRSQRQAEGKVIFSQISL